MLDVHMIFYVFTLYNNWNNWSDIGVLEGIRTLTHKHMGLSHACLPVPSRGRFFKIKTSCDQEATN